MINCIIIEDQFPAQRILKKYIQDIEQFILVGTYTNALLAKEAIENQKIDLIFLDIHLPKISGIDFLKSLDNPPYIIFTTAFSDFAIESYELNVIDYLLKPFPFSRFKMAAEKVISIFKTSQKLKHNDQKITTKNIFIKSGHDHFMVDTDSIIYINSDSDYTDVYTETRKYISSESLKYWEDKLSDLTFIRIHKSFIINTQHLIKANSQFVYLNGSIKAPIGRTYKKNVLDLMNI